MTPLTAIIGLLLFAAADLVLGFLLALKAGTTSLQKLPSWLETTVLRYVVPSIAIWVPQTFSEVGSNSSTALTVAVYGAVVTAVPKLAQDVAQKLLALVGQLP